MDWNLLPFIIILLGVLQKSSALNCYQCTGSDPKLPFQCNEWLSDDIDIKAEPCDDVYDAKFCVKHVGRYEGGIGAKRFCSSLDLGNYCNYVKQPGDKLWYRTCIHTCTGDGCNPGNKLQPGNLLSFIFIGFILSRLRNLIT